jgi:uncharacterized protein YbaR (Trm112 family)
LKPTRQLARGISGFGGPGVKMLAMISQDLLNILVCPVCKKPLTLQTEGSLRCAECRRVYPVRDNIPILLADEATIDPA